MEIFTLYLILQSCIFDQTGCLCPANGSIVLSSLFLNEMEPRQYRVIFKQYCTKKQWQNRGKDRSQQLEHMQVHNETGEVSGGEHVSCGHDTPVGNVLWESLITRWKVKFGYKVTDWYKVWSVEGCQCILVKTSNRTFYVPVYNGAWDIDFKTYAVLEPAHLEF